MQEPKPYYRFNPQPKPEKTPKKEKKPLPKPTKPLKKQSDKEKSLQVDYKKAKKENGKLEERICTGCLAAKASGVSHIEPRANKKYFADPENFADHCYLCNCKWGGQIVGRRKELKDYWPLMNKLKVFNWKRYRNYLEEDYPEHPDLLLPHPCDN